MPIPAFNYANIPPQGDPMIDAILPGILQGMKLRALPQQQQQQSQANQLANALMQIKLKNAPQEAAADLALKQAQTANIPVQNQLDQAKLAALLQQIQQKQTQPSKLDLLNTQNQYKTQQDENKNWDKLLQDAREKTQESNQLQQYATQFSDAYDKSYYTGQRLGSIPSKGLFSLGGTNEQNADLATQNMVAAKLALMKNGGRFTNYGLKFVSGTKPDRSLTKDAKEQQMAYYASDNQRMNQLLPFMNYARQKGLSSSQAEELWNNYLQKNQPTFTQDKKTRKYNIGNIGNFKDFLDKQKPSNLPILNTGSSFGSAPGDVIDASTQQKMMNAAKATSAPGLHTMITLTLPNGAKKTGTIAQFEAFFKDNPKLRVNY